jgi:PadR family transcriptional regulator, regulatory protein PadR
MENQSSMTKYFILAALKKKEMHGYELIMELEKISGHKPSASQIYPVLKKMNSRGYVTSLIKMEGKKKLKVYSITASGRQLFSVISKRFDSIIAAALKEKIKICAHCGCEMLSGAVSKRIGGKLAYFCCNSCMASHKS